MLNAALNGVLSKILRPTDSHRTIQSLFDFAELLLVAYHPR